MSSGKVKCTCGWSWNKSDSSKKDMYICHQCGRDNSNNMKNGGWLDNYNDSEVSLPEGYVGEGYDTTGRNYSPAWGGSFQMGGSVYPVNYVPQAQWGLPVGPFTPMASLALSAANKVKSWFSDDEPVKKPVTKDEPVKPVKPVKKPVTKVEPRTLNISDPRKVLATTNKPLRPNSDLVSGKYSSNHLDKLMQEAKRQELSKQDMMDLSAMGFQETKWGRSDDNIGHVMGDWEGDDNYQRFISAYKEKMKLSDKLGIKDPALRFQVYNGLGTITPKTEKNYHGFEMQKIYGVPIPKEGINMKKNPLYGKQVMDIRDNVLAKNPEYLRYMDSIYKAPVPKYMEDIKVNKPSLLPDLAMGGSIPGAVGFSYARTNDPAPSNGPYAKKTMASAQNGKWLGNKLDKQGYITSETKGGNRISFTGKQRADDWINKQIDSGKFGFDPKTGATFPLKKPAKGLSKEDQFMATKQYHDLIAPEGFTNESQQAQIDKLPELQQDMLNAENTKRRKSVVYNSMQDVVKNPLFYAPGAIALAPIAAAGLTELGIAASPYITNALATQLPGMATVPGATVGNAITAGFAGHGLRKIGPDSIEMYENPSWENAFNVAMDVAESLPVVGPATRTIGEGLSVTGRALGTESGLLSNAYKYNPWAFKSNPEAYYRGVGKEGMDDILNSGIIRSKKQHAYPEPYFSKGKIGDGYAKGYFAELNNEPMKGVGSFETGDLIQTPVSTVSINNPNLKLYQKDWLQGYKPIEVPKQPPSSGNVVGEIVNKSITPIGYDPFTVAAAPLELLTPKALKFKPQTYATKNRFDAWRLYNGLEPEFNTFFKNADGTLAINDFRLGKDELQNIINNPKKSFGTMEIEKEFNFGGVHGNGWITKGIDDQGRKFIDFTDTWDLQPLKGVKGLPKKVKEFEVSSLTGGKPFDLKNRIYYDDASNFFDHNGNKLVEEMQHFPKGVVDQNKAVDLPMLSTKNIVGTKQMDVLNDWNKATNQKFLKGTATAVGGVAAVVGYLVNKEKEKLEKENTPPADSQIEQKKQGGVIKDDLGQWAHPGEITEIGSNQITMEGVPYPVLGISDTGDTKLMKPGKNYKFKGKKVTEYPMAKNGIRQEQKGLVNLDQLTNFTNYNTKQPGGWLDKY